MILYVSQTPTAFILYNFHSTELLKKNLNYKFEFSTFRCITLRSHKLAAPIGIHHLL